MVSRRSRNGDNRVPSWIDEIPSWPGKDNAANVGFEFGAPCVLPTDMSQEDINDVLDGVDRFVKTVLNQTGVSIGEVKDSE